MEKINRSKSNPAKIEMTGEQIRKIGYQLVDAIANLNDTIHDMPITKGKNGDQIRELISSTVNLPESGTDISKKIAEVTKLFIENSLHNGHPKFLGYITSSPAPIGILAEMLTAAVNPNTGGWRLSPVATEIEAQTIRWIAQFIGFPANCGGIFVSGGNMANILCFYAARKAKADWDIRTEGMQSEKAAKMRVYTSSEVHTWIQKAADLSGLGTDAVRLIETDNRQKMKTDQLKEAIEKDLSDGLTPFMVAASAGTVSTGAVDPMVEIGKICVQYHLWFHVDGAYGGLAAAVDSGIDDLKAIKNADSIAIDPHKWLYAPLDAGCALTKNPEALRDAYSFNPSYYNFDKTMINYFEQGPENSRRFRALKVWLAFQQVGADGYRQMISDDIAIIRAFFNLLDNYDELEKFTCNLSIATFRFLPADLAKRKDEEKVIEYLNDLNRVVLERLESGGEVFVSTAIVGGLFALRACIVNFRTTEADMQTLPEIILRYGHQTDKELRPKSKL